MSELEQRVIHGRERLRGRFLLETHRIRTRRAVRTLSSLYLSHDLPPRHASSPVIVVGMHRSGTSLTARILHSLGVDMGHDADTANHESLSFVMRNRLVLTATDADWDHPAPLLDALANPDWTRALALLLDQTITAPRPWLLGLHEPPVRPGTRGWGWKDPRNSLTWPVWLELYPTARFVRVQRNRSDVIKSLTARSRENLRQQTDLSIRTLTEHGADALCSEYAAALAPLDALIEPHRIVDIRYEDLVTDPTSVVSSLAAWVGAGPDEVASAVSLVRTPSPNAEPADDDAERAATVRTDTLGPR